MPPPNQGGNQQGGGGGRNRAPYSNPVKLYANWNMCYSCGFDVEDGHTSQTFPVHLRKPNHQVGFNRTNYE